MHGRTIGLVATLCLLFTILWLVFYLVGLVLAGPLDTYEQVLAYASARGALYDLSYVNAALVTVSATLLFAGLYVHCRRTDPTWAALAQPFVPIYCALNLVVYLSQIAVVPQLDAARQGGGPDAAVAAFLLRQAIQTWPGSVVSFLNNLAYAVLAVPSLIYGLILYGKQDGRSIAGLLLALNGVACLVGLVGTVVGSQLLRMGTILGGVLFLLALFPLRRAMYRYRGGLRRQSSDAGEPSER